MIVQIQDVIDAAQTPSSKRYHVIAGITHILNTDDFAEASRIALQPAWNGGPFPGVWDRETGDWVDSSKLCY